MNKSILLILGIFLIGFISASLNVTFTENDVLNDTYEMNFNLDYIDMIGYKVNVCFNRDIEFVGTIVNSPFAGDMRIIRVIDGNKSIMAIVTAGDAVTGNSTVGKFVFKLNNSEATLTICKAEVVLSDMTIEIPDFQEVHVFSGINITIDDPEIDQNDTDTDTNQTDDGNNDGNEDTGGRSGGRSSSGSGTSRDEYEAEHGPLWIDPDAELDKKIDIIDLTDEEVIDITPEPKSKIQAVKEWISNVFKSIGNWFKNLF